MFDCSQSLSTPFCYYSLITMLLLCNNFAITALDATTAVTGEGHHLVSPL